MLWFYVRPSALLGLAWMACIFMLVLFLIVKTAALMERLGNSAPVGPRSSVPAAISTPQCWADCICLPSQGVDQRSDHFVTWVCCTDSVRTWHSETCSGHTRCARVPWSEQAYLHCNTDKLHNVNTAGLRFTRDVTNRPADGTTVPSTVPFTVPNGACL